MKIYLCTTVPSKNYRSWSNIPYLLHKNLEKKGYVVNNYIMREVEPIKTVFNLPIRVLNKFTKLGTIYFYARTPVHFFCTYLYSQYIGLISNRRDVMVILGFFCPPHNGKNRQIFLSDWPLEYVFDKFLNRKPRYFERKAIDRENAVIETADAVVTLFPNVREYMLGKYKNPNIYCFKNVVNIDDDVIVPYDIQQKKLNSRRLLFIGQPFYLAGALELIAAASQLRQQGVNFEVDIVGIPSRLIGPRYEWLTVHGYLDKGKPEQKEKYYNLLSNTRLLVNTTPGWSSFQALLEAMYFYTPVVVRENDILKSYYPNLPDITYIVDGDGPSLVNVILESISDEERYQSKSSACRQSAEPSSWDNFIENFVELLI